MTETVLSRESCATRFQRFPHPVLQFDNFVSFAHNVILMQNITKEVPIIELVKNLHCHFIWEGLEPVPVITSQRDIESDNFFDFLVVDGAKAYSSACRCKAMQECLFPFIDCTLEKASLCRWESRYQE